MGWIFGKIPNGLRPPPHFRKIMLQFFFGKRPEICNIIFFLKMTPLCLWNFSENSSDLVAPPFPKRIQFWWSMFIVLLWRSCPILQNARLILVLVWKRNEIGKGISTRRPGQIMMARQFPLFFSTLPVVGKSANFEKRAFGQNFEEG